MDAYCIAYQPNGDGSMNYSPFAGKGGGVSTLEPEYPVTPHASSVPKAPGFQKPHRECLESSDTDPYDFLKDFDTIFLIDDSGSMAGRLLRETGKTLEYTTPICTPCDGDDVDFHLLYEYLDSIQDAVNISPTGDVEVHTIASDWPMGIQHFETGKKEGGRAAFKQPDDGLSKLSGDENILTTYFQKASPVRRKAVLNTVPKDRSRSRFRIQSLRINPIALTFLTMFALLPTIQAAPHHISTTWGIPISNTLGIGTGLAISVFNDDANTNPVLYWLVYGFWSLSALLVIAFTIFSIRKTSRLRYLCTFVLMEFILLTMIAVSSIGDEGLVTKHLREWTPLATLAVAGALTVGFKRVV